MKISMFFVIIVLFGAVFAQSAQSITVTNSGSETPNTDPCIKDPTLLQCKEANNQQSEPANLNFIVIIILIIAFAAVIYDKLKRKKKKN